MKVKDKKKPKTKQPTTRAGRKPKNPVTLPIKFTPKFLDGVDGRQTVVKEIRRRLERLKADAGVDSYQQELLAEQAIFISTLLQSQMIDSVENKPFELGSYVQMVNTLVGLLKALGLKKSANQVIDLKEYWIRPSEEKASQDADDS